MIKMITISMGNCKQTKTRIYLQEQTRSCCPTRVSLYLPQSFYHLYCMFVLFVCIVSQTTLLNRKCILWEVWIERLSSRGTHRTTEQQAATQETRTQRHTKQKSEKHDVMITSRSSGQTNAMSSSRVRCRQTVCVCRDSGGCWCRERRHSFEISNCKARQSCRWCEGVEVCTGV
jgi:hypothetical protein